MHALHVLLLVAEQEYVYMAQVQMRQEQLIKVNMQVDNHYINITVLGKWGKLSTYIYTCFGRLDG